jgi:hypothetical protein
VHCPDVFFKIKKRISREPSSSPRIVLGQRGFPLLSFCPFHEGSLSISNDWSIRDRSLNPLPLKGHPNLRAVYGAGIASVTTESQFRFFHRNYLPKSLLTGIFPDSLPSNCPTGKLQSQSKFPGDYNLRECR